MAQENLEAAKSAGGRAGSRKSRACYQSRGRRRTFGSVSSKEIAAAVKEQMKLDVDKKKIVLKENIEDTRYPYRKCKTPP